ncbi:MAG: lysophospholipid acyltransferase family protein [Planctomycetia bacterium]|nr:lysophospholipid acyltransferase family protein [Planctomycetia bacterium]
MKRSLFRRLWYAGTRNFFLALMRYRYGVRFRYSGVERLPTTGAVLLAANHESFLDPPAIGAGVPRMINYLARESLFRANWFFGLHLRLINVIPLELDGDNAAMIVGIRESVRRLRAGETLIVFPEGTRSEDGEIHTFRSGFVILANRTRCPILPVAVVGPFELLPRGSKKIRPGVVDVRFGEPIPSDQFTGMSREEIAAEVRSRVLAIQAELREERKRPPT